MYTTTHKVLTAFVLTLFVSVTSIGIVRVLMDQVLAIAPANNIQLMDQSGPGNQQPGYTNGNTIQVQFDHDNTADAFFLDENPVQPPCGIMIPLTTPNNPNTQNVPAHNLTPGDGLKQVFVHLVDHDGDGCGGNPDQFASIPSQITLDTGVPADPVAADFNYTIADTGSLSVSIVDGGSGLDFQIVTSGTTCNVLANAWNSGVDAGTGFAADAVGIATNPTLIAGAGAVVGENICIRVRDKAGNVSNFVADGQIVAIPAPTGGSGSRLFLESQKQNQTGDQLPLSDTPPEQQPDFGNFPPQSSSISSEYEKLVESVRLMIPDDVFGHQQEYFILDLYLKGILDPLKITFDPDKPINRAEMLKIVMTAFPGPVSKRKVSPFSDTGKEWFEVYFIDAYDRGIITGYGDRTVRPSQNVTRVEALAMLSRAAKVNLDYYRDKSLTYVDLPKNGWYMPVVQWAVSENIVLTSTPWFKPDQPISRAEMAQITSTTQSSLEDEPCNCDKEKAAWEAAAAAAVAAQAAADAAAAAAGAAAAAASDANKAAKDAQDKVNELNKFFDDTSSASSGGETVTTGDLELLREANRGVYDAWKSGAISAQEASDAWGKIDPAKLAELRAKKAAELAQAKKDAADAKAKADAANKASADAAAKAAAAAAAAAEAKAAADAAKAAYDACLEKCRLLKAELAAQRAATEAANAAAAAAAAEVKRKQAADDARRAAETKAQQDAEAAKTAGTGGGGGGGGTTTGVSEGGGTAPGMSEGPCKPKFTAAVKARAAQVEARGGVSKPPGETAVNVATTVLDALGGAAGAVAEGGSNAAAGLAAGASLMFAAYGLWVDYVGSSIKAAGQRIVSKRICQIISTTTDDGCGHITSSGQTVYYERTPDGKLHVLVMGPGDSVVPGECEG